MSTTRNRLGTFAICLASVFGAGAHAADEGTQKRVVTSDQVAAEIQENTRYLASQSLAKAKSLLEAYDDFAPFGAALFPSGKVKYVWAVKPGEDTEGVNPMLVLNSVRQALKSQADEGRILGSAVVYRFLPEGETDTNQINIELEYLTGFAQVLGTQYQATDSGYEYGDGAFKPYDPVIFAENEGE
ncbi:MAG: hypothetical protein ACQEV6_05765 [Pseudomonadota bacterium]